MLLLVGCAGSGDITPSDEQAAAANEEAVVLVSVEPARQRSLGQTISALGRCEALPQQVALLTPVIEGRIQTIQAKFGDEVTAGQAIVQLDATLAKAEVAEKLAARDSLSAALASLESLPRPEEQQSSKLAIASAQIVVERVQAQLERLQPLKARNEIADAQIAEAQLALDEATVQKATAQAQFDALMLRPREAAIAEAQSKIKMADEALKTAQTRVELHTIRAPIAGVLNNLTCRLGQTIGTGSSIGEIVDCHKVLAVAWLPVQRSRAVQAGQTAHVALQSAFPRKKQDSPASLSREGRVEFVGRSADPQTGSVPVQVLVDNQAGMLVVGQTLSLVIDIETPTGRLCVPAAAVHDEGEGAAVTVVREGKAIILHPRLGLRDAEWVEIMDTDLKTGEPVAVAGAYNLPDGTPVKTLVSQNEAEDSAPAAESKGE